MTDPRSARPYTIPRVKAHFDKRGKIQSLFARSTDSGLTIRQGAESHADAALRFVLENPSIWDLQDAEIRDAADLSSLHVRQVEANEMPDGQIVTTVHFDQFWRELSIIDSDIRAIFWGDRLVSWSEQVVNSANAWIDTDRAFITLEEAERIAGQQLTDAGHTLHDLTLLGFGASLARDRAVFRMKATAAATHDGEDIVESFDIWLDAQSGEPLRFASNHQHYPTASADYRVYAPHWWNGTPDTANILDMSGGYISTRLSGGSTQVYPWRDILASRSQTPVYNDRINWSGGSCSGARDNPCLGFNWQWSTSGYNFTGNPGTPSTGSSNPPTNGDKFRLQHVSYWTQKAVDVADINFNFFPPANSAYKYARITSLVNRPGCCKAVTSNDGCWGEAAWRKTDSDRLSDRNPWYSDPNLICIKYPMSISAATYGPGQPPKLSTIFHEVGHAVQIKYLSGSVRNDYGDPCIIGSGFDEPASLNETLASLYSMTAMMDIFPSYAYFNNNDAVSGSLAPISSPRYDAAPRHSNDSDIKCHGEGTCWDDNDEDAKYNYGRALLQAYWEVSHGENCDVAAGQACVEFEHNSNYAPASEARWAFFYALKSSGANTSYREFVSHFLNYYWNSWDIDVWGERRDVFDHHRLIANSAPAGSPCH